MSMLKSIVKTINQIIFYFFCLFTVSILQAKSADSGNDDIPPVLTGEASDITLDCTEDVILNFTNWYQTAGGATATDNSELVHFFSYFDLNDAIDSIQNSSVLCNVGLFVTFYAQDTCGNLSVDSTSATFNTIDDMDPVIVTQPKNVSLQCYANVQDSINNWINFRGGMFTQDLCSDTVFYESYSWNDSDGNVGNQTYQDPPPQFSFGSCDYELNVFFLVNDGCGNTNAAQASFVITDKNAPVLSAYPEDLTISCHELDLLPIIYGIDDCQDSIAVLLTEVSGQGIDTSQCNYYQYSLVREYTVTDWCGNTDNYLHEIFVIDTIAPNFEIQDSLLLNCAQLKSAETDFAPFDIIDNCDNPSVIFEDQIAGNFPCEYEISRLWTLNDVCGNQTAKTQIINVINNIPPSFISVAQDISFDCDAMVNIPAFFDLWISDNAGAEVVSICGNINQFAAVPGSYDVNDINTFPGTPISEFDLGTCPSINFQARSQTIDFVFYDACGNIAVSQASFSITDTIAPIIDHCPQDITVSTTNSDCSAIISIVPPSVSDNCGALESPFVQSLLIPISSTIPGDNTVPVDTTIISFGPINIFNTPANGNVTLDLMFNSVDVNDPTEFFIILDEQGNVIDSTETINTECGDTEVTITLSNNQINQWATDGFVTFIVVPNIPSGPTVFSVNDICGGSSVSADLTFDIDLTNSIRFAISIDGGDTTFVNNTQFDTLVNVGHMFVEYFFIDCSNNVSSCLQSVAVMDLAPPDIVCPNSMTIELDAGSCQATVTLSSDFEVNDNCGLPIVYDAYFPDLSNNALINFSYNDDLDTFIADNILMSFIDVIPINFADQNVQLEIEFTGDHDNMNEYFEIFGENGFLLGNTAHTSAECGTTVSIFEIPLVEFNSWQSDGQIDIIALPVTADSSSDLSINNCSSIVNGETTDGISTLRAHLYYVDVSPTFYIEGATNILSTDLLIGDSIAQVVLNAGLHEVFYLISDEGGNQDSCKYEISIVDKEPPIIICKDFVALLDPSGQTDYILDPHELVQTMSDNCGIDTIVVAPNIFSCDQVGSQIEVEVMVIDLNGNTNTCNANVKIEVAPLLPSFSVGLCLGDALQMFANVPPSNTPNAYDFNWTGPNNFMSSLEHPIINNPSQMNVGTYNLSVTGFNNCMSMGNVEVNFQQLTTPVISVNEDMICVGEEILLSSTAYTGNILYNWFEGTFPNGVLIEQTQGPNLQFSPVAGNHLYYVQVESTDCNSPASLPINVAVVVAPEAMVERAFISVCEGDDIILASSVTDPSFTYTWSGPNNYIGFGPFPVIIEKASALHEGEYILVITNGACESNNAISQVAVFTRPITPIISGDQVYCEGNTMVLTVSNVTNADKYQWYLDGNLFITENDNSLLIPNVQTVSAGNWSVIIEEGFCFSDSSENYEVFIEEDLQIGASNSGPVCEGANVSLSVPFIPGANYAWESPTGETYNIQNPTVLANAGTYNVTVETPSGCMAVASTQVVIDQLPQITALSNNAQDCMDGTMNFQFFATVIPSNLPSFSYQWSGPLSFNDNTFDPVIENATSQNNGSYYLTVINGECRSDSMGTSVLITDIPDQPSLIGITDYCLGDSLSLFTNKILGANYRWDTPKGLKITQDTFFTISELDNFDIGLYAVIIEINGCISESSPSINVNILETPPLPVVTPLIKVCEGDTIFLNAIGSNDFNYHWSGPAFTASTIDTFIVSATEAYEGVYKLVAQNGNCESSTVETIVEILDKPEQVKIANAEYRFCASEENAELEICLDQSSWISGAVYSFYVNDVFYASQSNPCLVIKPEDLVTPGINTINIDLEFGGCRSSLSETSIIIVDEYPDQLAQILQVDQRVCEDEELIISVENVDPEIKIDWSSNIQEIAFSDQNGSITSVTGLDLGENIIELNYSYFSCVNYSQDQIEIVLDPPPLLEADSGTTAVTEDIVINILDNDVFASNINVRVLDQPEYGVVNLSNGVLQYSPDPRYAETAVITYEVCSTFCPDNCATTEVTIFIEETENCVVPSIITPNGDNVNDYFIIPCLSGEAFPQNRLVIFNEWGDEIYSKTPYRNEWNGTYDGREIAAGTYFYVLDLKNNSVPLNGFIVIEK